MRPTRSVVATGNDECYTSSRDLIHGDLSFRSSSAWSASFTGLNAIDGLSHTRFSTQYIVNSWLQIDLGSSHRISEIRILSHLQREFNDVIIYLGNTDDFTTSPVYKSSASVAGYNQWYTFYGNSYISGRYLTFYKNDSTDKPLGFFELQVIPQD